MVLEICVFLPTKVVLMATKMMEGVQLYVLQTINLVFKVLKIMDLVICASL